MVKMTESVVAVFTAVCIRGMIEAILSIPFIG